MDALIVDKSVGEFYTVSNTNGNSGYDLYLPSDMLFPAKQVLMINFGISMKTRDGSGFWLLPRSSLSKTPLRLANSVGLIDPSYRGCLIGAIHNTSDEDFSVKKGTRLLQVALPSLSPFSVHFEKEFDITERGSGGFGSTGLQ
jgi:dUTP pyrophosphatase